MRSSSVAEAAALAAVRYARLADEKNKRRRNVERQKELVDIAGGERERERARKERAERIGGESGAEGAKDATDVVEKKERRREREKMTERKTGCRGSEGKEEIGTRAG